LSSCDPRFPVIWWLWRRDFWGIISPRGAKHLPQILSQELEPFGISGDELVKLTSRARDFSILFELADSPPPLRGPSARCLFNPVLRVFVVFLLAFVFDLVLL
jgi:hypothetical protein